MLTQLKECVEWPGCRLESKQADLHVSKWAASARGGANETFARVDEWKQSRRTRAISIHSFSFHWVAPLQWLIFLSAWTRRSLQFAFYLAGVITHETMPGPRRRCSALWRAKLAWETFSLVCRRRRRRQCGFWAPQRARAFTKADEIPQPTNNERFYAQICN